MRRGLPSFFYSRNINLGYEYPGMTGGVKWAVHDLLYYEKPIFVNHAVVYNYL